LKCLETLERDIDQIREGGERDSFSSEIRNDTERRNRPIQDRAVELSQDVSTALVSSEHDEGAEVTRPHLSVKSFLNSCIAYQY